VFGNTLMVVTIQPRVARAKNLAHPACAEERLDFERADR
jgi:hypothetical protein